MKKNILLFLIFLSFVAVVAAATYYFFQNKESVSPLNSFVSQSNQTKPNLPRNQFEFTAPDSIVKIASNESTVFVCDDSSTITALAKKDGTKVWSQQAPCPFRDIEFFSDDTVLLTSNYPAKEGKMGGYAAIDVKTGERLWHREFQGAGTAGSYEDNILIEEITSSESVFRSIGLKTGTENWSVNIPYDFVSDFYQDENNQYVLGVKGVTGGSTLLFAIRTADGSLLWKKQLGSDHQMVTGTHIVDKVGYVITNVGIEAFDLESGRVVSSFTVPFTTALQSEYRVLNGQPVFFGMTDSTLIAFKPDGTSQWERPLQMSSNSSRNRQVALLPVYISNNSVYSIDLNTGADTWVWPFTGNVMGSVLTDKYLYLQINKQPEVVIYKFDLESGQQLKALTFDGLDIGSTNLYKTEQPIIFNDWLVFSRSNLSELLANSQPLNGLKSSLHKKSFTTEEEIELPSLGDTEALFFDEDFIYLYRDAQMVATP